MKGTARIFYPWNLLCMMLLYCGFLSAVQAAVSPQQLALIVNLADPQSQHIARYYQRKRHIPPQNIIRIRMPVKKNLDKKVFQRLRQQIYAQTPKSVQFYAMAWTQPYRVACMSITSAMTFGFNPAYCARGCKPTKRSSYYNANTSTPYTDLGIRPSMLLAGSDLKHIKEMIDHGVAADGTFPAGTAYLVSTSDRARNVRSRRYPVIIARLSKRIEIKRVQTDALKNKKDVLFYFTGKVRVKDLDTNTYLPGAIADHLTSTGGDLLATKQMSILKWLDAGVTGSYGTVVEPCAFTEKFPNPGIVIDRYTRGESLIEAYWKSVAWPGQGLFVGEPLAAPFAHVVK